MHRHLMRLSFGLTLLAAFGLVGCGPKAKDTVRGSGTATGTVTLDGKPLTAGKVVLFDELDSDTASGDIGADGSFTLKYGAGFKIPCGDYRVSITQGTLIREIDPQELMKNPEKYKIAVPDTLPAKYSDAKKSGIVAVIEKGQNTLEFKLKK